ncbi:AAA family ATPase [Butyrivibrio sp. DSM 10294]|uniref:AAA family ATPase n=1 Tax=Butyrivibrio sp. DSM 10294 TaxID=2972457 RepID=UPI00234F5ED6|nr:AAA family ATPase [Butyrivibrio sp. DSM 10294]MBQ3795040.1 AAA family ATPase [Butyrivibrio sp.]MDC7292558.1 AAA family ATPase [Butyrivibrio sp. DSM 10294]
MRYIDSFKFPGVENEEQFVNYIRRTCYTSFYPFGVFAENELRELSFSEITILYGNNGSGKSTALNLMAEKLKAERDTLFNRSSFFGDYIGMCDFEMTHEGRPEEIRMITSDDVFDFMLNLRALNDGVDRKREQAFDEWIENKHSKFQMKSLDDYDQLKKVVDARSKTQSKYVRDTIGNNIIEHSNGESALQYFSEKIKDNGLYLLDEPENSLSPQRQLELLEFIQNSARFFGCQFIIATHSPFLLALKGALIYDLDERPVDIKKWTELEGVRTYFEFFEKHKNEF